MPHNCKPRHQFRRAARTMTQIMFSAVVVLSPALVAGDALPPFNTPWSFEKAKLALVASADPENVGGFDSKAMGLDRSQGALATVYLPPGIKTYRGIWISDVNFRYAPGYLASVLEFAVIRHNWYFQDQFYDKPSTHEPADLVDPAWLKRMLKDLAQRTGHPELEHAPLLLSPKQAGDQGIVRACLAIMPERVIAVAYGFGDSGAAAAKGIPCTTANEVRNDEGNWLLGRHKRAPGSLLAAAAEQGYQMHWANSKPYYGMLMFQQAVLARLPLDQDATKGPVTLRKLPEESGWLGDLAPGMTSQWRDIAPFATFKGDKQRTAWLIDDVCAAAWRGYMTYNPPVTITDPTTPFGMSDDNGFKRPPIMPGKVTIGVSPTTVPSGKSHARLLKPDAAVQKRVVKVRIMRGLTELGVINGASGSTTIELGPGMHVLVPECELDNGEKMGGWPVPVVVSGNLYAASLRESLPAKLAEAQAKNDLAGIISIASRLLAVSKANEAMFSSASAALVAATAKADERIAAAITAARTAAKGKSFADALTLWSQYSIGTQRIAAARDEVATQRWTTLAPSRPSAPTLLAFADEWQPAPAAGEALTAYEALAVVAMKSATTIKSANAKNDFAMAGQLQRLCANWDARAPSVAAVRDDLEDAIARLIDLAKGTADAKRKAAMLSEIARTFPSTRGGATAADLLKAEK